MAKTTTKCYFCKKEIEKDNAYMWVHTVEKSGKQYKRFCCSLEEKEQVERDKELYKLCQYETDSILGRPITNNVRNKELTELHESGYSWEEIYRCIKANAQHIRDMIIMNNIENDYQQIRYMCQVIKNVIYDFTREDKRKNEWEQYKQVEEEVEVDVEETIVPTDMKVKKRKKLF
jgi:hypothetical protein